MARMSATTAASAERKSIGLNGSGVLSAEAGVKIMTNADKAAQSAGYTRRVFVDSDQYCFDAMVKPDADFDGTFTAWSVDYQEYVRPNGWLFTVEDM